VQPLLRAESWFLERLLRSSAQLAEGHADRGMNQQPGRGIAGSVRAA